MRIWQSHAHDVSVCHAPDVFIRAALDLDLEHIEHIELERIETAPPTRAGAKDQAAKEPLPRDARGAINDDSEEWHRSSRDDASSSLGHHLERAHRLRRLEQIETALLAERSKRKSKCADDDKDNEHSDGIVDAPSDSHAPLATHDRFCADCAILPVRTLPRCDCCSVVVAHVLVLLATR